jgi:hypothetical protein
MDYAILVFENLEKQRRRKCCRMILSVGGVELMEIPQRRDKNRSRAIDKCAIA